MKIKLLLACLIIVGLAACTSPVPSPSATTPQESATEASQTPPEASAVEIPSYPPITRRSYAPAPSATPVQTIEIQTTNRALSKLDVDVSSWLGLKMNSETLFAHTSSELIILSGAKPSKILNLPSSRSGQLGVGEGFFLVSSADSPYLYWSPNGSSWVKRGVPTGWPELENAQQIVVSGDDVFLSLTSTRTLHHSSNKGISWRNMYLPKVSIEDFTFNGSNLWVAAGDRGIYQWNLAQNKWSNIWDGAARGVFSVAWWQGHLYAVSKDNLVYRFDTNTSEPLLLGHINSRQPLRLYENDPENLWFSSRAAGEVFSYNGFTDWQKWPLTDIVSLARTNEGLFILGTQGTEKGFWLLP